MIPSIGGALVGLALGLSGGGGSILAVPILIYGLGFDMRRAVAVSLAVVGATAVYGAVLHARRGLVLWGAGGAIGLGGVLAAPVGARLGAHLPDRVALPAFSVLMLVLGLRMWKKGCAAPEIPLGWIQCEVPLGVRVRPNLRCVGKLVAAGAGAGFLSGVFGVGGGFLLVPALALVAGIGIEASLATSLVGIALIAASGFAATAGRLLPGDAAVLGTFLAGSAVGMTAGAWGKRRFAPRTVERVFAALLVVASIGVILATGWK